MLKTEFFHKYRLSINYNEFNNLVYDKLYNKKLKTVIFSIKSKKNLTNDLMCEVTFRIHFILEYFALIFISFRNIRKRY